MSGLAGRCGARFVSGKCRVLCGCLQTGPLKVAGTVPEPFRCPCLKAIAQNPAVPDANPTPHRRIPPYVGGPPENNSTELSAIGCWCLIKLGSTTQLEAPARWFVGHTFVYYFYPPGTPRSEIAPHPPNTKATSRPRVDPPSR